jgi:protein-disulfide isomerase
VEFSDFQCPFCGQFADTLHELERSYPDDVRVVFKQFPLPMHPDAELGSRATIAALAQGKFWAMHDLLFTNRTKMKREDVVAHANDLGLDVAKFEAALDDPATAARVKADKAFGISLGVRGTPSFFVNGRSFSGALPPEKLGEIIEAERKLGQALVDAGSARAEVYARIQRAAPELPPTADPSAAAPQ